MRLQRVDLIHFSVLVFTLILSAILPVSALPNYGHKIIQSSGAINYPMLEMAKDLHGFTISQSGFWYNKWKPEYFQQLRSWGFNTILIPVWWGKYESDNGVYDESLLQKIRDGVDMCKIEGFEVIISIRVCHDDTDNYYSDWPNNMPLPDYANGVGDYSTGEGRERFKTFIGWIAQRFPDCIICPWHMPYHMDSCSVGSSAWNTWHTVTFPQLLNEIRKYNTRPVIFVPIHQGKAGGTYFTLHDPFSDSNVWYGFGHQLDSKVDYGSDWDYDYALIDNRYTGIKRWKENFPNVQMISVEFAPLSFTSGTTVSQSRLDCLAYTCSLMNQYRCGWLWWRISLLWSHIGVGHNNLITDPDTFTPHSGLLETLQDGLP